MDVSLRNQPDYLENLWSGIFVSTTFHEGEEEVWCRDNLVPVAGAFFPRRFRLNLTPEYGSEIDACTAFEVENGTFVASNGMPLLGVPCAADHPRVLADLIEPLIRALAMVPHLVAITSDGTWRWKPSGWSPGPAGPVPQDYVRQVTQERQRYPVAYQVLRLREDLKKRMHPRWHNYYLPRIEIVARSVRTAQYAGLPVSDGIRQAEKLLKVGTATAYELLRMAREMELLPYGDAPRPEIPWWTYDEKVDRWLKLEREMAVPPHPEGSEIYLDMWTP
ncbi:hypothetical protein [Streptomyces sp. NBC_00454]|uniref:hypothetical protein n=1 Tax=Streptomyces sp. NBC_00454 TaxID=2975747 RepID=UPI0030E207D3